MDIIKLKKALGKMSHDERLIDSFIQEMKAEIIGKEKQESGPAWVFKYGSAYVVVTLTISKEEVIITFASPIMEIPQTRQVEFFKELLEKNARAGGAYFVIHPTIPESILLQIARPVEGLDYVEFKNCLNTVGEVADLYDDELKRKYGDSQ